MWFAAGANITPDTHTTHQYSIPFRINITNKYIVWYDSYLYVFDYDIKFMSILFKFLNVKWKHIAFSWHRWYAFFQFFYENSFSRDLCAWRRSKWLYVYFHTSVRTKKKTTTTYSSKCWILLWYSHKRTK